MIYYDETDKTRDIVRDIEGKHTPDSVREDAVREARRRGIVCNESGYVDHSTVPDHD